jgi:hypothetical protein
MDFRDTCCEGGWWMELAYNGGLWEAVTVLYILIFTFIDRRPEDKILICMVASVPGN